MYRPAKPWEDNKKKDKSDNAETMDEGLKGALTDLNPNISRFDCSCFDGEYVTGDIDAAYLDKLEASRTKPAKPASKDDEE